MFKRRKGQSILEYVVILIAIVGVVAWAANSFIKDAVTKGLNDANTTVANAAAKLVK
jgi:hypothetical protein